MLEFSMFPLVKGEGLGPFAARSLDFIDRNRIECSIKLDYRKGRRGRPEAKVAGVEQKLARPLNK